MGRFWAETVRGHRQIAPRIDFFNTGGIRRNRAHSVRYPAATASGAVYGPCAGSGLAARGFIASLCGVGLLGNKCSVKSA